MNAFDDVRHAVATAQEQLQAADAVASNMAHLLRDRLRKVGSTDTLRALKRELRDFDMTTGKWRRK